MISWRRAISRVKRVVPKVVRKRIRGRRYGYRRARVRIEHRIRPGDAGRWAVEIGGRPALSVDEDTANLFRFQLILNGEGVEEFHRFLNAARDPGGLLIDVGAHGGAFSLAFCSARPGNRAIGIEADPTRVARMADNASRSGLGSSITPVLAFAGNEEAHETDVSAQIVEVPTRSIDQLRAECGERVQVLKIDVDGAELDVLQSARRTLAEDRPVVFLELHHGILRSRGISPAEVLRPLLDAGYVVTDSMGRVRSARWAANERHALLRLVAVHGDTLRQA